MRLPFAVSASSELLSLSAIAHARTINVSTVPALYAAAAERNTTGVPASADELPS